MSLGLPPIDRSLLPPELRDATGGRGSVRDAYTAALGFEQLLVQQLAESLAESAKDALGGDSPYASMLPDALTQGVMAGGGLGLAGQLEAALSAAGHGRPDVDGRNRDAGPDAPRRYSVA